MSNEMMTRDKGDIRSLVNSDRMKEQFALAMPKCLTPDRLVRVALTAMNKTPKLAQCTQTSLLSSLMTCAELGIEPDGRRAHLIPYGKECTLIIDYKGLAELAMRSGKISNIHADVVCENDEFEYNLGKIEKHRIDFKQGRGEVYAVYAVATFKDGTQTCEVMSRDDVESIRNRSKAGKSGPWVTDWNEMAKKTAFRRLSKWLPLSPEYRDALDKDGDQLADIKVSGPIYTDADDKPHASTDNAEAPDFGDDGGQDDDTSAEDPEDRPRTKAELLDAIKHYEDAPFYHDTVSQYVKGGDVSRGTKDLLTDLLHALSDAEAKLNEEDA